MEKFTGIDLDNIDVTASAEKGHEFEVAHPETGVGLGFFITVRGEEASSVRLASIRSASEDIVRTKMKAQAKGNSKLSFDQQVMEQQEELIKTIDVATPEKAAQRVISWRGLKMKGADLPFTVANCLLVFQKMPFVQTQIFEESRKLGNFFKIQSTNSAPTASETPS